MAAIFSIICKIYETNNHTETIMDKTRLQWRILYAQYLFSIGLWDRCYRVKWKIILSIILLPKPKFNCGLFWLSGRFVRQKFEWIVWCLNLNFKLKLCVESWLMKYNLSFQKLSSSVKANLIFSWNKIIYISSQC